MADVGGVGCFSLLVEGGGGADLGAVLALLLLLGVEGGGVEALAFANSVLGVAVGGKGF